MKNYVKLLLLPAFLAMLFPQIAPAQEQIHIVVGAPGKNKFPLALPKPLGQGPAASEFYETIKHDLELSGWVDIINSDAYLEPTGTGVRPGDFKFESWDPTGALGLAKTKFAIAEKIRAEVWIYDIAGRKKLGAKAFSGSPKKARMIAHKVASEIIYRLTGQDIPFNTRFAAVGKFSGNKEIYLVDFDGENRSRVTRNGSINLQPVWSPDGSKIAFTSYLNGNPDLYIADLGLKKISRVSARTGLNIGATWKPNSKELALTLAPSGDPEIFTIAVKNGRALRRLTKNTGIDTSPTWSKDGSKIAFVSERSGGAQIYVMNADGSNVRRVTFDGGHNTDPAFSPDGKKLTFVRRHRTFDVYVINLDGSGMKRITENMGDNEDPSWSPNGNYIAFSSTRSGGSHIWMSTIDGSHQVQLTKGRGGYSNPNWSPQMEW